MQFFNRSDLGGGRGGGGGVIRSSGWTYQAGTRRFIFSPANAIYLMYVSLIRKVRDQVCACVQSGSSIQAIIINSFTLFGNI